MSTAPLYQSIRELLLSARSHVRQTVNTAMVQTYWHIGRMIVEDEQDEAWLDAKTYLNMKP